MITKFNQYKLINEGVHFWNNEDAFKYANSGRDLPTIKIGDVVRYIDNVLDVLSSRQINDRLHDTQVEYVKQHIKETFTVTEMFHGDLWWSRVDSEDNNSWIPNLYLTTDKKLPTYQPKTFIKENKKEEREKKLKKDELKYLSKRERERLTDSQRKVLVSRRKERGSWNDADLKESLRDQMVGKSEDEVEDIIGDLKPTDMLHHACKYGLLDYVKKAIQDGADVDETFLDEEPSEDYYEKLSAIDIAIENKQYDIVEYLLNNGYKTVNFFKLENYIKYIIKAEDIKLIDLLIKTISVNYHDSLVKTAIEEGKLNLVKYLLERHKLDINYGKRIYLREACRLRKLDIIKYLLDSGIKRDILDFSLKIAVKYDHNDVIDILLSYGVKPSKETLDRARKKSMKLYFRLLKNKLRR